MPPAVADGSQWKVDLRKTGAVVNGQVAVAGKGIRIGGVELLQFLPPFCMGEGAQS